jgi:putative ABC transport system permease protein
MKTRDVFSYAFSAIRLRKLRAGLTTLGVVIGIAAIVALLSLAQGFQNSITLQFEKGLATNTLLVSARNFGAAESSYQLFVNDTKVIDSIQNVTGSVAVIQKSCYFNSSKGTFLLGLTGVDFDKYASIYGSTFKAADGGSISSNPDNDTVVIGARIHDPWKNGTILAYVGDAVEITWTNTTFVNNFPVRVNNTYTGHVSAVLNEIGGFSLGGPSDSGIYVPIAQAQSFFGTDQCDAILVELANSDNATITGVSEAIKNAFGGQVSATSATAILDIISMAFASIELFLGGIAGISLLVAGIGIMNIMIVSLMERTREIGILKALGMKSKTVLLIFLSEAMIIGLLGAAIGIGMGWGLAEVFARVSFASVGSGGNIRANQAAGMGNLSISPVLSPTLFIGAFAFGLIVSVVFGIYPAWRASKLKPVEALRYE